ncbi:MAG TPA: DUF1648 domain-containing protein [Casimicrobiaceae bacterium]|jgi:hypothetical protein|nr:DUF1648 domain-containing protein [Casimicrobiaceae bacterium]
MDRLFYALAALAIAVSAIVIAATSPALPATVASHFGVGGVANGYLPRDEYELSMLALAIGIPFSITLLMATLPRALPGLVNVPNLRAWLASPRRNEALASLGAFGAVAAILFTACIAAAHLVLLRANAVSPPHLDPVALGVVLGVFGLAFLAWAIALIRRFHADPR